MKPTSIVSADGRTRLPEEIRRALGLGANDTVKYSVEGGRVFMQAETPSLLSLAGALKGEERVLSVEEQRSRYRAGKENSYLPGQ